MQTSRGLVCTVGLVAMLGLAAGCATDRGRGGAPTDAGAAAMRDAGMSAPGADAGMSAPGVDAGMSVPGVDAGMSAPGVDAGVLPPGMDAGVLPPGMDAGVLPPGMDAGIVGTCIDASGSYAMAGDCAVTVCSATQDGCSVNVTCDGAIGALSGTVTGTSATLWSTAGTCLVDISPTSGILSGSCTVGDLGVCHFTATPI